ncbi:hypothetical protein F4820DRAFT_442832 [Hypoxylon rubiginosum]|uniref:Uncharacterized protein n=1 Tax=Hypoxylon rubiginosum TaxID=110542 RepID=A0ACB9ZFW0_9PEZI|nr:hypothetical protein F4820DRAFT_442832 [Hypoxylon rubiginosum]
MPLNLSIVNDGGSLKCFQNMAATPPDCANRSSYSGPRITRGSGGQVPFAMVGLFASFVMAFILG